MLHWRDLVLKRLALFDPYMRSVLLNSVRSLKWILKIIVILLLFLRKYVCQLILENLSIIVVPISVICLQVVQRVCGDPSLVKLCRVVNHISIKGQASMIIHERVILSQPHARILQSRFLNRREKLIERILAVHHSLVDWGWVTGSSRTVLHQLMQWFIIYQFLRLHCNLIFIYLIYLRIVA